MGDVREILLSQAVAAPARAGSYAPVQVVVPAMNTGLGPEETSFFQALEIPTKIVKGSIAIDRDCVILEVGQRVTASEAALLQKLNIMPFSYAMTPLFVYDDGCVYDAKALEISDDDLKAKFSSAVSNVAALSLACGIPNAASFPHMIMRGFKRLAAVAVTTDYTFKEVGTLKAMLKDPAAFAAAAAPAETKAAEAPAEEEEESEEESDDDVLGALF